MGLAVGAMLAAAAASSPVPDFELRDTSGVPVRLAADPARATVVVFLGTDCPLANLYAPRVKALADRFPPGAVRVLAVSANAGDDPAAPPAFAAAHAFPFPYLHDPDGRAAAHLGVTRTPEAVVLDAARRIRYRGRIDDQYAPGGRRAAPSREDLAEAVIEVLAGKAVSVPRTVGVGCAVARPRPAPALPPVTYGRDIAPLLARHCLPCHRPGEIGPFPLTTFADARSHAATIAEVVEAGTMPPWHAAAGVGRFRNDRRLTDAEKRLVADWVRLGCPEGDPAPPAAVPPSTGWEMGVPDAVYPIPAAFAVPAEGVVEYQYFVVDPGFTADTWVRAAEVRPGNRRVVHHCTVFLTPPAAADPGREAFETGGSGAVCFVTFTPGCGPTRLTDGLARRVPAGWRFLFVVHYSPVGTTQTDRTELGLQFLPADDVRRQVETVLLVDPGLTIPPHAPAHRVERTWTADRDYLLLSMFPHMHLRGKSFRYTAEYPDGSAEVLLDVPAYDFNWQHRYDLAEPKRLPAGTVVRCAAVYDNSAANPFNPDPGATVRAGQQSWDEMFNGYFDVAPADQDLPAERAAAEARRTRAVGVLVAAGLAAVLWAGWILRGARYATVPAG